VPLQQEVAEKESLRGRIEVLELNLEPGFEDCYTSTA